MNISKIIIILFSLSLIFSCKNKSDKSINPNQNAIDKQNEMELIFKKLLSEKNSKKDYVLGSWEKEKDETHFKYLGNIRTNGNENLTIVNQIHYFGEISRSAQSRILIFQDNNKYIGYYYFSMIFDLPTKFDNGFLYFDNNKNDCDKKNDLKVDFRNGIPKQIFKKCKGDLGDLYEFQIDD